MSMLSRDPVATVGSLFGSVYRETSITKRQPLFTLPFEARLEVVEEPEAEERRWIKVRLPDMREAWIQRGDITLDHKPTVPRRDAHGQQAFCRAAVSMGRHVDVRL